MMMSVAPFFHLAVPLGWGWLADKSRRPDLLLPSHGAPITDPAAAIDALVGLGWSAKQAADAVDAVTESDQPAGDVAGTLRAALRHLGRSA